jgi:hypothetical protein
MSADPLDPVLRHVAADDARIDREKLKGIHGVVSRLDAADFIEAVILAPGLEWDHGQDRPKGFLEIHGRQWWIDATGADNRAHILTAITAAALIDALSLQFSAVWVTQVLPGVLTAQSVRFDEAGVYIAVRLHGDPRIPDHLADIVNPRDYDEFVEAVSNAGDYVPLPAGGAIGIVKG